MGRPAYVSEQGVRIPRITVKEEERRNQKGKTYYLHTFKVCGDTEDEVLGTLKSLRFKSSQKKKKRKK